MNTMLNLYRQKIFYPLMNRRLGADGVRQLRRKVLSTACGAVLEIGFGSGLNLDCYPDHVRAITAIDPGPASSVPPCAGRQVCLQAMSAESMQFPDNCFDSVVSAFTLCSIADLAAALDEIRRVLKPGGQFIFLEHGKSPNRWVAALQDLFNPFYNTLACGCNVNRDILKMIAASGLRVRSSRSVQYPFLISGLYFYGTAVKPGGSC